MTGTEIAQLEQQLAVRLPSDFRTLLPASTPVHHGPLTAEYLIAMNQRFRASGILNNIYDERWPAHFIRIGGDGTGHVSWFVRCDSDPSGIWQCDHDVVGGITQITADVARFLDQMLWE
jgi:hypothetical protein